MSQTEVEAVHENLRDAEETLSTFEAERASDEHYLGEPCSAPVVDFDPDPDDGIVGFMLELPNGKLARLTFNEYHRDRGHLDAFLDDVYSTVDDLTGAVGEEVPVTYTEYKGWLAFYGESPHLDRAYAGNSRLFTIDDQDGFPVPNTVYGSVLSAPFFIGPFVAVFGALADGIGVGETVASLTLLAGISLMGLSLFAWYLQAMFSGMTSPHKHALDVEDPSR